MRPHLWDTQWSLAVLLRSPCLVDSDDIPPRPEKDLRLAARISVTAPFESWRWPPGACPVPPARAPG